MRSREDFNRLLALAYGTGDKSILKDAYDEAKIHGDDLHLVVLGYYYHGPVTQVTSGGQWVAAPPGLVEYFATLRKEDPSFTLGHVEKTTAKAWEEGFLPSWKTGNGMEQVIDVWWRTPQAIKDHYIEKLGADAVGPLLLENVSDEDDGGEASPPDKAPVVKPSLEGGFSSKDIVAAVGLTAAGIVFFYLGFTSGDKKRKS